MPTAIKKSIPYGRNTLTLETGEIARQAGGAVLASLGDSVVLVSVVAAKQSKPGQDFRSRSTTASTPTRPDAFPAGSSNARDGLPKRRR